MNFKLFLLLFCLAGKATDLLAQRNSSRNGAYGHTLNIGIGLGGYAGYYNYIGRTLPIISANYEFDVARDFTLAPFLTAYSYGDRFYAGNTYYRYRQTVVPIGIKASYYLDNLLRASNKWDFYGAGSLGVAVVGTRWDQGYTGNKNIFPVANTLFLDLHLGAEYHITNKTGLYLDLSTGVTTLGLAFH